MDITLSEPLVDAARRGDALKVKQRLYNSVEVEEFASAALLAAAKRGHDDVVRLLLNDRRADPADDESFGLCFAASRGHVKVVTLLLKDGRANPASWNSDALWAAAWYGHVRVVKAFLRDGRADPTASDFKALMVDLEGRHTEVVAILKRAITMRERWNSRCVSVHIMIQVSLYVNAQSL